MDINPSESKDKREKEEKEEKDEVLGRTVYVPPDLLSKVSDLMGGEKGVPSPSVDGGQKEPPSHEVVLLDVPKLYDADDGKRQLFEGKFCSSGKYFAIANDKV